MNKLRIGVIGCGFIANSKHLPALKRYDTLCEVTAFCDIKPERAEKAKAEFGAEGSYACTDYQKLLDDKSLDVIHVCTPNVTHRKITCGALEAGKHVMCEKPMAITSAEAKAMLETAKKCGKKLTIGYQNRFRDDALFLRKAIDDGRLGEIYYAQAHAIRRRCVPTWGVFTDKALQGGGPLIDLGTHALDLTLWYMDNYDIDSVTGSVFYKMADKFEANLCGPWDPAKYEVEDSAFGFIKMKNGATINLYASWVLNTLDVREACTTLCGKEGGAEMRMDDNQYSCTLNYTEGGKLTQSSPNFKDIIIFGPGIAPESPGDREAKQWLYAILENKEPLVKPEQALVVTQILESIYQSAAANRQLTFGEK
jgi:predicted dehydrogenase